MSKVLVDLEDEDSVFIRIERSVIGLAFDELEDEYLDRGMRIGACGTIELTLELHLARQLRAALNREEV